MKVTKELDGDIAEKNAIDTPFEVIHIENKYLRLSVIPSLGGKVIELLNKRTGTQFLKECDRELSELHKPLYGDDFLPPFAFGFDECFPNIAPGSIEIDNQFKQLPDHGEIWTQSCSYKISENQIIIYAEGSILEYTFIKKITLHNKHVIIDYHLISKEKNSFNYVWSAHPLLNVKEGDEIVLDESVKEVVVDFMSDDKHESSESKVNWPFINKFQKDISYDRVQNAGHGLAAKLFIHSINNGCAGIYYPAKDESISFNFDSKTIPHTGLWLCYGGWPQNTLKTEYTIAIEPARGGYDSLEDAIKNQKVFAIEPGEEQQWQIVISVGKGRCID